MSAKCITCLWAIGALSFLAAPANADLVSEVTQAAIADSSRQSLLQNAKRIAAEVSEPLDQFRTLSEIFERLGPSTEVGVRWRDVALPIWLAAIQHEPSLVKSMSSSEVPVAWGPADSLVKAYVTANLRNRPLPSYRRGFIDSIEPGVPPSTFHPLVLRHVLKRLVAVESTVALPVVKDLAEHCITRPQAGVLGTEVVIETLRFHGLAISPEGEIREGSLDPAWRNLAIQTITTMIENAENIPGQPVSWKKSEKVILSTLQNRPSWSTGAISSVLSTQLRNRIAARKSELSNRTQSIESIVVADFASMDAANDLIATSTLPTIGAIEFSPAISRLEADTFETSRLLDQSSFFATRQYEIGQLWRLYRASINSPFVRAEAMAVEASKGTTYSSTLLAENSDVRDKLLETAFSEEAWVTASSSHLPASTTLNTLEAWKTLDTWNGLRAGAHVDDAAAKVALGLFNGLPAFLSGDSQLPVQTGRLDSLRADLFAISILGLAENERETLVRNIGRHLVTISDPSSALSRILLAARTELLLTSLTQPEASFQAAFASGELSDEVLSKLGADCVNLLNSKYSFENRAGMNGFVFLGNLAEVTGDPTATAAFRQMETSNGQKLVAETVQLLLSGDDFSKSSSVGLALIGSAIRNFYRWRDVGIEAVAPPNWIAPNGNFTSFYDRLIQILSSETAVAQVLDCHQQSCLFFLLKVAEVELSKVHRRHALSIESMRPSGDHARRLRGLLSNIRFVFCRELTSNSAEGNTTPLSENTEGGPWWRISYWADRISLRDETLAGELIADDADGFALAVSHDQPSRSASQSSAAVLLVPWMPSFSGTSTKILTGLAEEIEAEFVNALTANPLVDIDGVSRWQLPTRTWDKSFAALDDAIESLRVSENAYKTHLNDLRSSSMQSEIVSLLRKPLMLGAADYQEQVYAALAEVKAAEYLLESSIHTEFATEMEELAAQFVAQVAEVEFERQHVLGQIVEIETKVAETDVAIAGLRLSAAQGIEDEREIAKRKADLIIEKQELIKDRARKVRDAVTKQVEIYRHLLITSPDASRPEIQGQIGMFGVQIEKALIDRLEKDLQAAEVQVETAQRRDRERKKLERRRRFVNSVARFTGAVVGVFLGGPTGAALGAEIGGALGETINGVMENRPIEEILVGLSDNAIVIAEKSGFDLEKELNTLGAKTGKEATAFFSQLEDAVSPILQSVPEILDKEVIQHSMAVLGIDKQIPEFTELLNKSFDALSDDAADLGTFGTFLTQQVQADPFILRDRSQLKKNLEAQFFQRTQGNASQLRAIAKQVGLTLKEVTETDAGRQKAASRLAALAIHQIGTDSETFRATAWRKWLNGQQAQFATAYADIEKQIKVAREQSGLSEEEIAELRTELIAEIEPDLQSKRMEFETQKQTALEKLFPNGRDREIAEKSVNSVVSSNDSFQGKAQLIISNWQSRLNERLDAAKADCESEIGSPSTEVEVAQASLTYLTTFKNHVTNDISPWLKTEGREEMEARLTELIDTMNEAETDFAISEIDSDIATMTSLELAAELERLAMETEARKSEVVKFAFQSDQAQLGVKAHQLSVRQAELTEDEKVALQRARKARRQSANAQVLRAKEQLKAAEAYAIGKRKRAAVSREIRQYLSQPPLVSQNDARSSLGDHRHSYTLKLRSALRAYRDCLRQIRSINQTAFDTYNVFVTKLASPADDFVWSTQLETLKHEVEARVSQISVVQGRKHIFSLNSNQIDQLERDELTINLVPSETPFEHGADRNRNSKTSIVTLSLTEQQAATGRIAAIIIRGTDSFGNPLDNGEVFARHLGIRRPSINVTRFTKEVKVPSERVRTQEDGPTVDQSIISYYQSQSFTNDEEGVRRMFAHKNGTSLSGTTTISLRLPEPRSIQSCNIIIHYLYFEE